MNYKYKSDRSYIYGVDELLFIGEMEDDTPCGSFVP